MLGQSGPYRLSGSLRGGLSLFLVRQFRPLLRPPKKEFPVPFIVGASGVPLALAGVL
jgi:hypothetical protein